MSTVLEAASRSVGEPFVTTLNDPVTWWVAAVGAGVGGGAGVGAIVGSGHSQKSVNRYQFQ